ncbi:MAG: hypothetical protein ABJF01_04695 [bacterium]
MRRRVGLATYARAPELAPDDQLLLAALEARGIAAEPAVWSNDAVQWDTFDAVVIRSCWDYHLSFDAFMAWLDRLEALAVPVYNPPGLVRWNANKRYLLDLAQRGVPTIPTTIIPQHSFEQIDSVIAAKGWSRFVIKPAISASGYETYSLRAPLDADSRRLVERVTTLGDALVQPFVEEISTHGEYSFTFIDGEYSHTTLKRATMGEFRVQSEHGGTAEPAVSGTEVVSQAARALAALSDTPLYARVDGVVLDGVFLLMEMELIEPNLFLEHGLGAPRRMAEAIAAHLVG